MQEIPNPNIEIRTKPKDLDSNYKIPNGFVWSFLGFRSIWKLFRVSDFEFRILFLRIHP
jgi:hypothetical protein